MPRKDEQNASFRVSMMSEMCGSIEEAKDRQDGGFRQRDFSSRLSVERLLHGRPWSGYRGSPGSVAFLSTITIPPSD